MSVPPPRPIRSTYPDFLYLIILTKIYIYTLENINSIIIIVS